MKTNKNLNSKTVNTLIYQKKRLRLDGGIAKCIEYENKFFFKSLNLKNKNLIEFGCGIFPSSIGLNKNEFPKKYVATDTSKKLIKIAKQNDNRPIYKTFNLEKNSLKEKFDVIVLKGVLHHTKKPENVLIKLKKNLKPNGFLIINEPNLSSLLGNFLKWFLEFFFKKSMEDSPYGQYDFKKISHSVKKAKLKINKKWYSTLLLLILSGDYGRFKIFPDNKFLYSFIILLEKIFYYFFNFFKITKYLYFKVNLIIKK
jgi:2-polyprenyl-3-methyl-5-hydroxy-6-metoxy-1,4-benzoquinol methylase